MKKHTILLIVLAIAICICAGYAGMYYYDVSAHTNVLLVQVDTAVQCPGNTLEEGMNPGDTVNLEIFTTNQSYRPIHIRETTVISVFNPDGTPKDLDGTSWMPSAFDLYDPQSSHPLLLTQPKIIQNHQTFYTSTYALDPAQQSVTLPFVSYDISDSQIVAQTSVYNLVMSEQTNTSFSDCIVKVDIIVEGQLADNPNGSWEEVASYTTLIGTNSDSLPRELYTVSLLPASTVCTNTFHWDVQDGYALLVGVGSVDDTDVVIPAQIRLRRQSDSFVEDPVNGNLYNVVVAGDAFFNCDNITSVFFHDGVMIKDNLMYGEQGGMFQNSDCLTGVYNIPDSVIGMQETFRLCRSLKEVSTIPATDLTGCFYGCTALESAPIFTQAVILDSCFEKCSNLTIVPNLPDSVLSMESCFSSCTALVTPPEIPPTVNNMRYCFYKCSSLSVTPVLPKSANDLSHCFDGCTSLTIPPIIPSQVTNMRYCFYKCNSLVTPPTIPSLVTDMSYCFYGCSSLTAVANIPDSVTNISHCYEDCISLTGSPTFPARFILSGNEDNYMYVFQGCTGLDSVLVDYCPRISYYTFIAPDNVRVKYVGNHVSDGLCPICGQEDVLIVDGMYILSENVPDGYFQWFLEILTTKVPDELKEYCIQIMLTDELGRHDSTYLNNPWVDGFAWGNEAYIEYRPYGSKDYTEYVIYHELAHTLDAHFTISYNWTYSVSNEWIQLHEAEGYTAAQHWYNWSMYNDLDYEGKCHETFAMAVGKYFSDPNALKYYCPGMYEYVDELFHAYD